MRASTVHVTDHALLRWRQRASKSGEVNVFDIIEAIKRSKVIKKNEPLPYPLPRMDGSVYSFLDGVLFVMEPVTIDEYRLVTVISSSTGTIKPPNPKALKTRKKIQEKQALTKKKISKERREKREEDVPERPQRNRTTAKVVHVQPAIAGVPAVAAEGDSGLQPPAQQDSAA